MKRLYLLSLVFVSFSASAGVIVDGKDWWQPSLFTNNSWNDIAAVCNAVTGSCTGSLNGIDITGSTWASVDDVNALFNSFIPGGSPLGPGPSIFIDPGSTWAPSFLSAFVPTASFSSYSEATGWTRTSDSSSFSASDAYLASVLDSTVATQIDWGNTLIPRPKAVPLPTSGAFFFSNLSTSVPEPNVVFLLGLSLAGLGLTRRRQKQARL